jgi:hypothetical protein
MQVGVFLDGEYWCMNCLPVDATMNKSAKSISHKMSQANRKCCGCEEKLIESSGDIDDSETED